jgi:stage V sporulation protein SpoVS
MRRSKSRAKVLVQRIGAGAVQGAGMCVAPAAGAVMSVGPETGLNSGSGFVLGIPRG